jgi:2'-5' RNA ligase
MTTIVAPVPEAEPLVADWRSRYDWSALRGVPAHITLLGPFLPPDRVGPGTIERLRALFAGCAPFSFTLTDVRRVGGVVFLAPEPVTPFKRLTRLLESRCPEAPAYGSAFERTVYHLTVAREPSVLDKVRTTLEALLPLQAVAREACLLEHVPDRDVRTVARFAFDAR